MTIPFNADEEAALASRMQQLGFFLRIDNPDPAKIARVWLGVQKISVGVNVLDPAGATYYGFGSIIDLPAFTQLVNGRTERLDVSLSGLSAEIVKIATEQDAPIIKGNKVAIGMGVMSERWALLGPIRWMRTYIAQFLSDSEEGASTVDGTTTRRVTLNIASRFIGRKNPRFAYFTHQDQQHISPTDLFFNQIGKYRAEVEKAWPKG